LNEISVHWLHAEVMKYRSLLFDLPEIPEDCLFFHDESKLSSWTTPPVYFDDYMAPNPDIWDLSGGTTIATTADVVHRLEPFVSMSAEVLPLENRTGEELELFALNIVNKLNLEQCIDLSVGAEERRRLVGEAAADLPQSEAEQLLQGLDRGDPWPVLYPAFIQDCLHDPTLCAVLGKMLCIERDDLDDSLMRRIAAFNITGLAFTKIWSSATGPEAINLFRP
jgi:hypothetical protein